MKFRPHFSAQIGVVCTEVHLDVDWSKLGFFVWSCLPLPNIKRGGSTQQNKVVFLYKSYAMQTFCCKDFPIAVIDSDIKSRYAATSIGSVCVICKHHSKNKTNMQEILKSDTPSLHVTHPLLLLILSTDVQLICTFHYISLQLNILFAMRLFL